MALALDAVLAELLGRLGALRGGAVEVSAADLRGWNADAVAALHATGLLMPGPPAASIVCDGCEEACVRPVHVVTRAGGEAAAFVLCHLRDDIDRVAVALGDLARWRLTVQSLADALAGLVGGDVASAHGSAAGRYRLGFVQGKKQDRAVLHLRFDDEGMHLLLAGHVLEVQDALVLRDGRLAFDQRLLARCVDAPADGVDGADDDPEDRRLRLLDLVAKERARSPGKFLRAAADKEGITVYALKQVIYRKPKPVGALGSMARNLSHPVSKKPKT